MVFRVLLGKTYVVIRKACDKIQGTEPTVIHNFYLLHLYEELIGLFAT